MGRKRVADGKSSQLDGGEVAERVESLRRDPGSGRLHGIAPEAGSAPAPKASGNGAETGGPRTTRLLLVEDDRLLADSLARILEGAGFTVYVTALGEDALELARAHRFDVVLLDLTLPDVPGQSVLKSLRAGRMNLPVIILSGESAIAVKLEGFQEGADDYVVKPFHPDELLARVNAVIRRARTAAPATIHVGPLAIDLQSRRASVEGTTVPLTGKEFQCLAFLAMRRGTTVTKEMFLAHLYGGQDEPEMKIIDVFICKLRRKLSEAGSPPVIETVWGRGYTIPNED
ncbi:MAG: response regulator transcription factor [Sphingomonadaceae bacterium]